MTAKSSKIGFFMFGVLVALMLTLVVFGTWKIANAEPFYVGTKKYGNVARVFCYYPGCYSALILDTKTKELTTFKVDGKCLLFGDVPEGEPMWISVDEYTLCGGKGIPVVNFHIHSVKEVEGAGWNYGKGGSGQTNVVE